MRGGREEREDVEGLTQKVPHLNDGFPCRFPRGSMGCARREGQGRSRRDWSRPGQRGRHLHNNKLVSLSGF